MNEPLISVIVAVRNGERFIQQALQSIVNQTYQNWEIILVDGHSTDRTVELAQPFSKLRYVPQTGQGVTDGYNLGIAESKGEYIAFLSHDDLWEPNKLRVQMQYFHDHPEVQYVIGYFIAFLEPGDPVHPSLQKHILQGTHVGKIMETLLAKKALFDQIGNLDIESDVASDVEWYARAQDMHVPYGVVPDVILRKRIHNKNTTQNIMTNQHLLYALRTSIHRKLKQIQSDAEM